MTSLSTCSISAIMLHPLAGCKPQVCQAVEETARALGESIRAWYHAAAVKHRYFFQLFPNLRIYLFEEARF